MIWIIPLSIQQGQISFSTAGPYVHKFMHPDRPKHPIVSNIIKPPFEEAYFAWIDPVNQLNGYEWSAFDNQKYFNHQIRIIRDSLYSWYSIVDFAYVKTILILACMIILFFRNRHALKSVFTKMKIPLIVVVTHPLGYLFFFTLERYIFLSIMFFHLFYFIYCKSHYLSSDSGILGC